MSLLDEHGDEIEADLAQYYNGLDLTDLYRGTLSFRRLGVLVRQLPPHSRTVTAVNDGQPGWTVTDHLIADVWAAMVKLLGDPEKVPDNIDHPTRAAMVAKAVAAAKEALKAMFVKRKRSYDKH
ncbi:MULTISPECIES: hypothetical protein [Mycobacteroides]|uniref:hypothetical protein n=1 Tax=Mycobacteroides TaxID=670516 RepID=UPI0009278541|nr:MULTISPECIES: hypothetical protein [Mycobacteroides]SIM73939.1 Uncharacterised protein [Mycobacteroides abscessus subsp. abscessus]SIN10224.1 Uncharacterised protein [Mycobacteroides abscessus subsp. abscessus]SIN12939.1 Uncharacterised protein [Mycobacteroides abscessus subsp. abscessus]SLD63187.1 Uncharacterised protein [Mycobacteroides abscessus subsp. abscessus]SLE22675.1 Uncharacterised protein [Mycobacteroides abscessus subsp. abscessus]